MFLQACDEAVFFKKKWAKSGLFLANSTTNDKSVDGVLRTRPWGGSMVGTDKSTEKWRQHHPDQAIFSS